MVKRLLSVTTTNGPVIGFADTYGLRDQSSAIAEAPDAEGGEAPVWKWLGVPYGKAARWQRPVDPAPWKEAKETLEFGSMFPQKAGLVSLMSIQGAFKRDFVKMSEDSHTLNIFAPSDVKPGEQLPVLVWIYGGSLNWGSADMFFYDPTEWIRGNDAEGKRFIVVTGNYRTNIFGFFSTPDLLKEDGQGLDGNYGLYDTVFMLEWVQKNISQFGGAPSNVTVFGESAGSFLISNLLVSGRKLFKRAIMESAFPETMRIFPSSTSYSTYAKITSSLPSSFATTSAALKALRSLPFEELLQLHELKKPPSGNSLTTETGPNATWTEETIDRLRRGEWDEWIEEVMLGTNEDEGAYFALLFDVGSPEKLFNHFLAGHPAAIQPSIVAKYGSLPTDDIKRSPASRLFADSVFDVPALSLCAALTGVNNAKSGKKINVYQYRCRSTVDRMSRVNPKMDLGAMHCIEIPLIYNIKTLWEKGSHEEAAAKVFGDLWLNFATNGVPDPAWKPFTVAAPSWLAIDDWGKKVNEDLTGWEKNHIDFTGRGFCLPKVA